MAVTITATKYFTGTGPIKFSEIRDTFGDLPGTNVRISDYKRNSAACVDWDEDNTITPRVPDATENVELTDINQNIQLQDYRNTIKQYDVTQTGSEEERVYTDGNEADWNNNLSKNVNKDYNVTGTIYSNETSKYALTFQEGVYNNLYINVSGNIYGEGGAVGGGNGGGALYIKNTFICDKVTLSIANNAKIWAGGGGGVDGNDGNNGDTLSCKRPVAWTADNKVGNTHLCNGADNTACNRPLAVCKANSGSSVINNTNIPNKIIKDNVKWNSASPNGGNRNRCRGPRGGTGERGSISNNTVINYADRSNTYQCTTSWTMSCQGDQSFNVVGGTKGTKGNAGAGKGFTNRNVAMSSSPHKGNVGNEGTCNKCGDLVNQINTTSCGNDGNSGNSGGDWGQAAASGGSSGIAIRKKKIIMNLSLIHI